MKTILVAGSEGYIGKKLSERLVQLEYRVVGLDKQDPAQEISLKNTDNISDYIKAVEPDLIISAAGPSSFYLKNIDTYEDSNILHTLFSCSDCPLVYLSSVGRFLQTREDYSLLKQLGADTALDLGALTIDLPNVIGGYNSSKRMKKNLPYYIAESIVEGEAFHLDFYPEGNNYMYCRRSFITPEVIAEMVHYFSEENLITSDIDNGIPLLMDIGAELTIDEEFLRSLDIDSKNLVITGKAVGRPKIGSGLLPQLYETEQLVSRLYRLKITPEEIMSRISKEVNEVIDLLSK